MGIVGGMEVGEYVIVLTPDLEDDLDALLQDGALREDLELAAERGEVELRVTIGRLLGVGIEHIGLQWKVNNG